MKKILGFLMMFMAVFAMSSCSKENSPIEAKDIVPDPAELVFLASGSEPQTVTFTANADWKATPNQSWIEIDKPVGKAGVNTITVSIPTDEDNNTNSNREGSISITESSTGKTAEIKVTQLAGNFSITFGKESGKFVIDNENKVISDTLVVNADVPYTLQFSDSWVSYDDVTLKSENKIIFSINNDEIPLEAKESQITFVADDGSESHVYAIEWEGIEPTIEFFLDQNCLEQINDIMIDESYSPAIFVRSNIPWSLDYNEDTFITELNCTLPDGVASSDELPYAFSSVTKIIMTFDADNYDGTPAIDLIFSHINSDLKTNFNVKRVGGGQVIFIEPFDSELIHKDYSCPMFSTTFDETGETEIPISFYTNIEDLGVFALTQNGESSAVFYDRLDITEGPSPLFEYEGLTKKTFILKLKPDETNRRDMTMLNLYIAKKPDNSSADWYRSYIKEDPQTGGISIKWQDELGDLFISKSIRIGELAFKKPYKYFNNGEVSVPAEGGTVVIDFESDYTSDDYIVLTSLKEKVVTEEGVELEGVKLEEVDGYKYTTPDPKIWPLGNNLYDSEWVKNALYGPNKITLEIDKYSREEEDLLEERVTNVYVLIRYNLDMSTYKTTYQLLGEFTLKQPSITNSNN